MFPAKQKKLSDEMEIYKSVRAFSVQFQLFLVLNGFFVPFNELTFLIYIYSNLSLCGFDLNVVCC